MSSISIDREGFLANVLLAQKGPCRVATTANITLSGEQTIDGVAVVADDRVLVKNQTDGLNAIYVCKTGDWELAGDFDQRGHVVRGTRVYVTDGDTQAATDWYVTTTGRPYPGRQSISFSQVLLGLSASDSPQLTAINLGHASDTTITRSSSGVIAVEGSTVLMASDIAVTVQAYDADTLKADTPDTLTAGFDSTSYNIGTVASGTLTPVSSNGNFQHVINNGGHAINPPTNPGSIVIEYTNSTGPGSITTTGFNIVLGSPSTVASIVYQAAILKTSTIASLTWVSS